MFLDEEFSTEIGQHTTNDDPETYVNLLRHDTTGFFCFFAWVLPPIGQFQIRKKRTYPFIAKELYTGMLCRLQLK